MQCYTRRSTHCAIRAADGSMLLLFDFSGVYQSNMTIYAKTIYVKHDYLRHDYLRHDYLRQT